MRLANYYLLLKESSFLLLIILNIFSITLRACQGEIIQLKLKHSRNGGERVFRNRRGTDMNKNNLHGQSGEGYYLKMEIGTPPQQLNVLVDTGSSNFAIAAAADSQISRFFLTNKSSTFEDSGSTVYVPYTQGDWSGKLGTDLVHIASLPNITVRSYIAFITESSNFFLNTSDWQGIIGFAYKEISRPDGNVEPYFDSLVKNGHIDNIFSMHLCGAQALPNSNLPNSTANSMDGTMLLGGVSDALYTGELFYTPIHKEWYYEVVLTDIQVNNISLNMDCKEYNFDKTIVDSGTTNLRLPDKVFQSLISLIQHQLNLPDKIPNEFFWSGIELMCWENRTIPYLGFPTVSLSLLISNNTYFTLTLLPQQYLRPVQDPTDLTLQGYCFKFGIATSASGTVMGAVLMEGFYVIFDRKNKRMGFGETTCAPREPTLATVDTKLTGPHIHTGVSLLECAYIKPERNSETLLVVAYVMAGVCIICVMPLLIMVVQYQVRKCRGQHQPLDSSSDTGNLIQR